MSVVPLSPSSTRTFRRKNSIDQHANNVPASKVSVIRTTCDQIYRQLLDVSESMSDELLEQTCTVVLHKCNDAIGKSSMKKNGNNSTGYSRGVLSESLQAAISQRMAKVVEKRRVRSLISVGSVKSVKSARKLFAILPKDDGLHDVFLNICDPDLMTNHQKTRKNYLNFKRSDSNVPFMMFVYFCGAFFMFTGFLWSIDINVYRRYPTAILSIFFGILGSFCVLWITWNRVVFLSYQYNTHYMQRFHKYVLNLYNSPYGQWIDNGVVIFTALSTGFYLVNIVLMDLCDPDVVVRIGRNNHHRCDSYVEPPPESFMLTMISIVVFQIVARGVSRIALVCSWVVCIVAINVTLYLSDSGSYAFAWINLLQFLILWFSYELERQPLRQFIKTTKAMEAGEMAAKLQFQLAACKIVQASDALAAKCSMVRYFSTPSPFLLCLSHSHLANIFPFSGASPWT